MIKKVTLILMCLVILVSCGRKADPKYETSHYKIITKNT